MHACKKKLNMSQSANFTRSYMCQILIPNLQNCEIGRGQRLAVTLVLGFCL